MPISYAQPGDYTNVTGDEDVPTDIVRRLARASAKIRRVTKVARWATDSNGYATDATIRTALKEATCWQAFYARETGTEGGIGGSWTSVSIGNAALSGGTTGRPGSEGTEPLSPDAEDVLMNANLLRVY